MDRIDLRLATFIGLAIMFVAACQATAASPSASSPKIAQEVTTALSQLGSGQALAPQKARSDADGRLQVYVYMTDFSAASLQALRSAGLKRPEPSPSMGVVQGWIAPGDVGALAALDVVTRITLPRYAIHH